ncbi:MAG: rnb [Myxococcales bacterium]|nr:rnb [Myxococcales bacterium]
MNHRGGNGNDLDLVAIARRVLTENGFDPEMPNGIERTFAEEDPVDGVEDLRRLPWSSIDNHDSRDLDQVEVAERLEGGAIRMMIGIADVDALVPRDSPVDVYARTNTATLYTGVHIFPMLPEELSTDRTSLLPDVDRLVIVTEMIIREDGSLDDRATRIYPALVRNHAKLVYEKVGAWLEEAGPPPEDTVIADQVVLHDEVAQRLRKHRYEKGALDLETIEARPVTKDGRIVDLVLTHKNRARELVEDLMIGANGATAKFLESAGYSSIRRVVRAPKRWDRIVELARIMGATLPVEPDAPALSDFLAERRQTDPTRFADLSLSVVKLLGPGEYVLQRAADPDTGHFGLAVEDYAHSTAPNRRYPDLITQRLLKAAARKERQPYSDDELTAIAAHCTERENAARKVERTMRKVAAAVLLSSRIGDEFDGVITGATPKGTYARLFRPPAEGRVVTGERGLDVGDKVRVRLVDTNPQRGFIDFAAI